MAADAVHSLTVYNIGYAKNTLTKGARIDDWHFASTTCSNHISRSMVAPLEGCTIGTQVPTVQ